MAPHDFPDLPQGSAPLGTESAALLGRLATRRNRPHRVTVAREPIEDLEATLGSVIPFDVVALLAVEERRLGELRELTTGISEHYALEGKELGRGLARELGWSHVAFALLVGTPDDWTEEPRFAAFPRGTDRTNGTIVEWVLRKPSPGAHPYSLRRYLAEKWHLTETAAPPLELVIAPPSSAAVVYATHAKYGPGRVVARGEGKATVEFADGSTRTLAERFLVFER